LRAGIVVLASLIACALIPSDAFGNGTVSREDRGTGVRIYWDPSSDGVDWFSVSRSSTDFTFSPTLVFTAAPINAGPGCTQPPFADSVDCARTATATEINLGSGHDEADLGELGPTHVQAGSGDDGIYNGAGADDVSGGAGTDLFSYEHSDTPVRVTFDGVANDGTNNERDNVRSDIEQVQGGSSNDTIINNATPRELRGGPGDDSIDSYNGVIDVVNCGPGTDQANVDPADTVTGCERVYQDADRDGYASPADCNDANAAVHPGAYDLPDNRIDEDCSGGDAQNPDRDGDGYSRPADCNDANAAINPSAIDRPGNGIDENCDGRDAAYQRLTSSVINFWRVKSGRARVRKLIVLDAPFGATVEIRCKGRGCPFKRKRLRSPGLHSFPITRLFKGHRLRTGAVLEIRVTMPDTVGKVVRFRMRASRLPKTTPLCLAPQATKPKPCGQVR
jgi:hypothetical protein